jgi:hypothetical protein
MGEIFSEYIGVLAFLLFLVFPKIFRWLITRGGRTPSPVEKTLEDLLQGEIKTPDIVPQSVIIARREELSKLQKRAEKLKGRTTLLLDLCASRGGAVGKLRPIVEAAALSPLNTVQKELRRLQNKNDIPNEHEIAEAKARIQSLKSATGILEQMVSQRIQPASASTVGILDIAVEEGFLPYFDLAERRRLAYSTKFAMSLLSETGKDTANALAASAAAVATVAPKLAEIPRGWTTLVSDISMDVFLSTRGLSQRIETDAGAFPSFLSILQISNPQVFVSGLTNAWLPRIFGDIGAAVYLGPGMAAGLASMHRWGSEEDRTLTADIGGPTMDVPIYVRMYVVCRALQYTGFGDEASKVWESWKQRLGHPTTITIRDKTQKTEAVSTALVLNAAARAVDVIIAAPIVALGNQLLFHIPGLRCTSAHRAQMEEIAASLIQGIAVNAPSRIIIGAALAAAWKSPTLETRIGTLALKSISGKGEIQETKRPAGERVVSVRDAISSQHSLVQAMAVGALFCPRRSVR